MSGHSKWSQIKHKKGAVDQKKAKEFSKMSRAITLAAKEKGEDPSSNPKLRLMIEKARALNMPFDNIERAIKKAVGAGALENLEEAVYEAYGPSGTAIIIETITDNKNRALNEIKIILNKYDAKIGTPGSALWAFTKTREGKFKPKHLIKIENNEDKEKLQNLIEELENLDDTQNIITNAEIKSYA